ncbi:MAG: hypothetical protein ACK5XN_23510 [Bacteroidota bacterium]
MNHRAAKDSLLGISQERDLHRFRYTSEAFALSIKAHNHRAAAVRIGAAAAGWWPVAGGVAPGADRSRRRGRAVGAAAELRMEGRQVLG